MLISNGNVQSRVGDEGAANKTLTTVGVERWDPVVICPAAGYGELLLALGRCRTALLQICAEEGSSSEDINKID